MNIKNFNNEITPNNQRSRKSDSITESSDQRTATQIEEDHKKYISNMDTKSPNDINNTINAPIYEQVIKYAENPYTIFNQSIKYVEKAYNITLVDYSKFEDNSKVVEKDNRYYFRTIKNHNTSEPVLIAECHIYDENQNEFIHGYKYDESISEWVLSPEMMLSNGDYGTNNNPAQKKLDLFYTALVKNTANLRFIKKNKRFPNSNNDTLAINKISKEINAENQKRLEDFKHVLIDESVGNDSNINSDAKNTDTKNRTSGSKNSQNILIRKIPRPIKGIASNIKGIASKVSDKARNTNGININSKVSAIRKKFESRTSKNQYNVSEIFNTTRIKGNVSALIKKFGKPTPTSKLYKPSSSHLDKNSINKAQSTKL